MAVATTANYANLGYFIEKMGLEVAQPKLQYARFGKKFTIPEKSSKTIKFRRYERLAPTTGKDPATMKLLVEGTTPSDVNPTVTDYTLTLSQYGNVMRFSDQAVWTTEVSVDTELMKRNSENMAQTKDRVAAGGILAGTQFGRLTDSIGTIGAGARSTVNGILNAVVLDKVLRALKTADAEFLEGQINAGKNIGTSGVRKAYVAICHPGSEFDVERIQGFKAVSDYPDQSGILEGEIGSYKNIRFVTSTLAQNWNDTGAAVGSGFASTSSSNNDVYGTVVLGANAYGVVSLKNAADVIYNPQNKADKADPANQFATLAWKCMDGSLILNDAWIYRIEHCVTA